MIFVKDKLNNVNSDVGFLFANEFNSLKNELANVVKYRSTLVDNDDFQLLRAIISESKILFYNDIGTVNHIHLNRNNELGFKLYDKQTFIFNPKYTNSGSAYIKIGDNVEKPIMLNGSSLSPNFLNPEVTYMAVYDASTDNFSIKNLTIGNSSDYVFTSMHNESEFIKVTDVEIGTDVINNTVVYVDQLTNKYEKAIIENPKTQKQNAIGIYKEINGNKYIFFGGIVPDFNNSFINGLKYYLSNTNAGMVSNTTSDKSITIGRYIKDGKFKLDISGDVSIKVGDVNFKTYNVNEVGGESKEGVIFTDISKLYTLMYDKVTFDPTAVKFMMHASINSNVVKIEFAPEYLGKDFNISYNGSRYNGIFTKATNVNNPVILSLVGEIVIDNVKPILSSINKTFTTLTGNPLTLEIVTASDNLNGDLNVVKTGTVDFNTVGNYNITYTATDSSNNSNSVIHTYIVNAAPIIITYNTNVTNPQTKNGVTFTDPSNTLTLMFDSLTFDQTIPAAIMFIKVNNITAKLDYAVEYINKPFEIDISGVRYVGTFTENENYSNPTVINLK